MLKEYIKQNILYIIGALVGAIFGYFYWKYIGDSTQNPSPTSSIIWGAILFGFVFGFFKKKNNE